MKLLTLIFLLTVPMSTIAQEADTPLLKVFRITMISPGVEYEQPISKKSMLAIHTGLGLSGGYKQLNFIPASGIVYFVAPFVDLSYKNIYNREARSLKGKSVVANAGTYWGVRLLSHFKEIHAENIIRYATTDFALGPRWGLQRTFGQLHVLFDAGPVYYFDISGNQGFFPLSLQLNIGYQAKVW